MPSFFPGTLRPQLLKTSHFHTYLVAITQDPSETACQVKTNYDVEIMCTLRWQDPTVNKLAMTSISHDLWFRYVPTPDISSSRALFICLEKNQPDCRCVAIVARTQRVIIVIFSM